MRECGDTRGEAARLVCSPCLAKSRAEKKEKKKNKEEKKKENEKEENAQ